MSNVLIGIIGVILFIGLALAGALFLGPRFQEATNASRASAMVQSVSQIASALDLRALNAGQSIGDVQREMLPDDVLVTEGYLKSMPVNPYGMRIALFYDPTTSDPASVPGNRAYFVEMFMPTDAKSASVCSTAQLQTSGSTTVPDTRPRSRTGCFKDPNGNFRIFARL
jgi:type II secretory pathway pseudopilin PulG